MSKINLIHYKNIQDSYGEEALVNATTNEILLKGDYYHDKISIAIKNFINGLRFANIDFEVEEKTLSEEECRKLPFDLDFYYEDEITTSTNTDYVVDYSCNGMNEKEDDEIELNKKTNYKDENDEDDENEPIDDINAFLNGAFDKNIGETNLYKKEKSTIISNKYCVEIDGEEFDFYENSIEIAILSAWNYNGYLYKYNENNEKDMIFTPFEDACVNNVKLKNYGIYINENDNNFYWINNNKKIVIDSDDYIEFF